MSEEAELRLRRQVAISYMGIGPMPKGFEPGKTLPAGVTLPGEVQDIYDLFQRMAYRPSVERVTSMTHLIDPAAAKDRLPLERDAALERITALVRPRSADDPTPVLDTTKLSAEDTAFLERIDRGEDVNATVIPFGPKDLECVVISMYDYYFNADAHDTFLRAVPMYVDEAIKARVEHYQNYFGRPITREEDQEYLKAQNIYIYCATRSAITRIEARFAHAGGVGIAADPKYEAPALLMHIASNLMPMYRAQALLRTIISHAYRLLQDWHRANCRDFKNLEDLLVRFNVTFDKAGMVIYLSLMRPHRPAVRKANLDPRKDLIPTAPRALSAADYAKEKLEAAREADAIMSTLAKKAKGESDAKAPAPPVSPLDLAKQFLDAATPAPAAEVAGQQSGEPDDQAAKKGKDEKQ